MMDSSFFNPVSISLLPSSSWKEKIRTLTSSRGTILFLHSDSALRLGDPDQSFTKELMDNTQVRLLSGIESNPSIRRFVQIRNELGTLPRTIIALGGGSVIDVAKILIAFSHLPANMSESEILRVVAKKDYLGAEKSAIRLIVLPTTAGTGSELTKWATIWDMENKKKYSVEREDLYPTEAWIDARLTLRMPRELTISTGLDALSHATEAYWSTKSNPIVRRLAVQAIHGVVTYLQEAVDHPEDLVAREGMSIASVFAGLAFSQTRTTACHALSYPLTARFGIPHGFAVSLFLPHILRLNWDSLMEKELFLSAYGCSDREELENLLSAMVSTLVRPSIGEIGDISDTLSEDIGSMGARLGNNPINLTEEMIMQVVRNVQGNR